MPDMTELIAVQKLIQAAIRNSQAPPECEYVSQGEPGIFSM